MPHGEGIVDKYDSSTAAIPGGVRNRLIYRIEQGMGRAVRSHVDYAVVILAGPSLANFIAKHEVLNAVNPDTKAQLKLALHLAKIAIESGDDPGKSLEDMISQCLRRVGDWKQYYDENVRKVEKRDAGKTDEAQLSMANSERGAFQLAAANDTSGAVRLLRQALNSNTLPDRAKGWYLQRVANYMHNNNPGEALEIQRSAYEKNNSMYCPPAVTRRPIATGKLDSQATVLEWYRQFENPNGAIAAIQELRTRLVYSGTPETLEQAILELAPLLGTQGSRPEREFGEGPDDLWLWPSMSLVIEAKNEDESLHKKDAGQLLLSLQWFKRSYPALKDPVPVMVAKAVVADRKAGFPDGTRVLTQKKMNDLLASLEAFFQTLTAEPLFNLQPRAIAQLQVELGLSAEQFVKKYTEPVKQLP